MSVISRGSKGARDQVIRAERAAWLAIGERDELGRLGLRELRQRAHGGELHLLVDRRGAAIERAAKDEREASELLTWFG